MSHKSYATAWHDLAGKIAPEVLTAPKTGGDKHRAQNLPTVNERTVKYLDRNVVGEPWANHLALAAAVLTASNRDVETVQRMIHGLHKRFKAIFTELKLLTISDWHPEKHIPLYIMGKIVVKDTDGVRLEFVGNYSSAAKSLQQWISSLPVAEQQIYEGLVLPIYSQQVDLTLIRSQLNQERQDRRKSATDALVPHFAELRAEAHLRHNKLARLLMAYKRALAELNENGYELPFCFSFEEGTERLHFRIWDHRTFVLSHPDHYAPSTVVYAQRRERRYSEGKEHLFLELVKAESLIDGHPSDGYWFVELLRGKLLGSALKRCNKDAFVKKLEWFRQWGYIDEAPKKKPTPPFYTHIPGLLISDTSSKQIRMIQTATQGVIVPVQTLYDAATFGLLAISLFTTTGMRSNELLQIRLSEDCFFRLSKAAPPGAKDKSPRVRYGFRLIPKGERRDIPQDYFIGQETFQLLETTAKMLKEHYGLKNGEVLPLIPFSPLHKRSHRFGEAHYLFQYGHRHIGDFAVNACMRFLMHGMVFLDKDGNNVVLTAHLLRHAFATYAAHVEKLPIDVIGAILHHKNLNVTEYYQRATESIVANWQENFLDGLAAHINLDKAILRTPEALQEQLTSALERTGTVHQTIGGDCTLHAVCPIQFACIGCAANVPDPKKRYQVEREQKHAEAEVKLAIDEGRSPDTERWKQYRQRCGAFLKEMDMIEAYRKDTDRSVTIRIEDIK